MDLIRLEPDLATPPMKIREELRSYSNSLPPLPKIVVFRET
jgi:hypothetical protein